MIRLMARRFGPPQRRESVSVGLGGRLGSRGARVRMPIQPAHDARSAATKSRISALDHRDDVDRDLD